MNTHSHLGQLSVANPPTGVFGRWAETEELTVKPMQTRGIDSKSYLLYYHVALKISVQRKQLNKLKKNLI